MKSFTQTIIVLIVLNLVVGSFAMAQKAPEKEDEQTVEKILEVTRTEAEATQRDAQKLTRAAKREARAAQSEVRAVQSEVRAAQREVKAALREAQKRYSRGIILNKDKHVDSSSVLIIPTAETNAEELANITEDMRVMSRIIDKQVRQSHIHGVGWFGHSGGLFSRDTQGIYLDGYGALFLMKVDFPLSPPVETEEEKRVEEDVDPIWEQARREMYEPENIRVRRDCFHLEQEEKYDAEKVEDLKRRLIKTLKHGANIRNLKPNEWVILAVTGEGGQPCGVVRSRIFVKTDKDKGVISTQPISSVMGFSSPAVLTIRVKKTDVETFSKGKLDFDQFRKRVQILMY